MQKGISTSTRMRRKRKKDDDAFATAFEACRELLVLKPGLFGEKPKLDDADLGRIRSLENQITPAARGAAIKRNSKITALALQYFRQHGAPANIGEFIAWLKAQGVLNKTNDAGTPYILTERAVRLQLRKKFGIEGKPGRKPR